jgi:Tol biopolymer transport system component
LEALRVRLFAIACMSVCGLWGAVSTSDQAELAGLVAYVHQEGDGNGRIRVVADDMSWRSRRLALGKEALSPRWSSDGRRLLFANRSGAYVVDAIDLRATAPVLGAPKRVASSAQSVDWSPDATEIAITKETSARFCSDLYVSRVDSRRAIRLTASEACEDHPAWSPDGTHIAFEREGPKSTDVIILDLATRRQRKLGPGRFPAWAPDGASLAYIADQAIAIIDPWSAAAARSLKPGDIFGAVENGLTWSADGTRLAFGFDDPQETFPLTHLATIGADGSGAAQLTSISSFPDGDPDWQPLCTQYGTNGDDVLTGTPGDDVICGLRGNDRLRGLGGHDVLFGGDGDDVLVGGSGPDWMFGAFGNDRLYARDGEADVVNGGPGIDRAWIDANLDQVSETERLER